MLKEKVREGFGQLLLKSVAIGVIGEQWQSPKGDRGREELGGGGECEGASEVVSSTGCEHPM